jgi:hypothetical protein
MKRMKQVTRTEDEKVIDLFRNHAPQDAARLRRSRQHELLGELALQLAQMLDKLDAVLRVDREQAISLLAEYSGLLELAVEDVSRVRDIDESFGGKGRRVPRVAKLAEKLEKGMAYLVGIFSVAGSGENLSTYNWKLIQRDVQEVLGIAQMIGGELAPPPLREAA